MRLAILFGTSGWSYQEWVGAFYPNSRISKLPFYAKIFKSVEVDSSFYRPPSKSMIAGWAKATGPDFKFSMKIPKLITHDRRLAGVEKAILDFIELVGPLEKLGKLGCLLIQLPPSFTFKEKRKLEAFFGLLPRHLHFAVEFRHESWNREETWDLLEEFNIANTITDSPVEFLSKVVITATTHSFVRWHGHGRSVWYNYRYSENELRPWLEKLGQVESQVPVTYAYFNNHYGGNAPANLLQLIGMRQETTDAQQKAAARAERYFKKETVVTKMTDFL
jgi:uncharacterized protein YecE (DUF72 family)